MSTHAKKSPAVAFAAIGAALSLLTAIAACGNQDEGGQTAPPPPKAASKKTPSPSKSPTPTPTPATQPFTGEPGKARKPVLAVKIDNVRPARPATGLARADIVYIEPVEAGLARILAVFSSHLPGTVGPVRSARESDLELLRQFGAPAFAYSGANSRVLPLIAKAPAEDVSPAHAGSPYFRGDSRPAPHNLYAKPTGLLAQADKASKARDIGFRFGPAPSGGHADTSETVGYSAFKAGFTWNAKARHWTVAMDGSPVGAADGGAPPAPSTVVVQYVDIRDSKFGDKWGSKSPFTKTVGSGRALVLRDGKAYDSRWSRPKATDGTTFTTADGKPMTFAPGQVWVVFASPR